PPCAQGSIPGGAARSPCLGGNRTRWKRPASPGAPKNDRTSRSSTQFTLLRTIRGRLVRRIGPSLAVEVDGRIAAAVVRRVLIARPEALLTRPGLQQGPIHGEVIVGQQAFAVGVQQYRVEKCGGDIPVEQAVAILRERGRRPDRVVDA